jgi:uncharacterized protein (DUF305 family)
VKAIARVLLAGALLLTGCTNSADPSATATPTTASQFGGTDLAWIELNLAMDEEILPLLDLVPTRSGSANVQALALQVQGFTIAELNVLRRLHDQAGLPAKNPHKGMPMPGMVTPEQVSEAAKLTGKPFDAFVVKAIEKHIEQSESLAESEDKSGVEPQTRSLASQIIRTRKLAGNTLTTASKEAS